MIDGDPNDFLDVIYSGQDVVYIYDGIKYWFQGYTTSSGVKHMEIWQEEPPVDGYIWTHDDTSMEKCLEAFLKARIFGGKTFWEAEENIHWVDS